MCEGCWEEYGRSKILNENVLCATELIKNVYEFDCVGGNLHVQLDDWNIEDCFFEKFEPFDEDVTPEQLESELRCFNAMKLLSLKERASALAIYDGYWSPPNKPLNSERAIVGSGSGR